MLNQTEPNQKEQSITQLTTQENKKDQNQGCLSHRYFLF